MFDEIFALEVVELVLLKVKLVGQADYFQSTQEEAEKSLVEDLFILGEFVLHNGVDEEDAHDAQQTDLSLESTGPQVPRRRKKKQSTRRAFSM